MPLVEPRLRFSRPIRRAGGEALVAEGRDGPRLLELSPTPSPTLFGVPSVASSILSVTQPRNRDMGRDLPARCIAFMRS